MTTGPPPQTQLDWLCQIVQEIVDTLNIHSTQLSHVEQQMSTIADLKTAADQLAANDAALASEVGTLSTAVNGLIAAFDAVKGGLSAADQATLDQAVAEVTTAAADLATQTQSLTGTQQLIDADNPPPTAPA